MLPPIPQIGQQTPGDRIDTDLGGGAKVQRLFDKGHEVRNQLLHYRAAGGMKATPDPLLQQMYFATDLTSIFPSHKGSLYLLHQFADTQ